MQIVNKTLDCVKSNDKCKVLSVVGCDKASKRLSELGLYKGVTVKVLKNDSGPLIIQLCGNKIALGKCLANKIVVEI